jgi:exonuclease VII small subunit
MTADEIVRQLESFIEELNNALKDCKDGILTKSEAHKNIDVISKVKKILPENSRQYKIFDRDTSEKFISLWWVKTSTNYVDKEDCKKFAQLITAIQEVLRSYEPEFLQGDQGRTEFHFLKGDTYNAKNKVYDTMKKSEKSLIIIDAYAGQDTEILKYIDSLKQLKENLKVQILTDRATPMFKELCNDLVRERGNIEVKKIENILHDRYLIIDESEVWLITSANEIGKKDFTMTKLKNREEIIKRFDELWAKAKNLDDEND